MRHVRPQGGRWRRFGSSSDHLVRAHRHTLPGGPTGVSSPARIRVRARRVARRTVASLCTRPATVRDATRERGRGSVPATRAGTAPVTLGAVPRGLSGERTRRSHRGRRRYLDRLRRGLHDDHGPNHDLGRDHRRRGVVHAEVLADSGGRVVVVITPVARSERVLTGGKRALGIGTVGEPVAVEEGRACAVRERAAVPPLIERERDLTSRRELADTDSRWRCRAPRSPRRRCSRE